MDGHIKTACMCDETKRFLFLSFPLSFLSFVPILSFSLLSLILFLCFFFSFFFFFTVVLSLILIYIYIYIEQLVDGLLRGEACSEVDR